MVGKKSGKALLREEGEQRSAFFHVPVEISEILVSIDMESTGCFTWLELTLCRS